MFHPLPASRAQHLLEDALRNLKSVQNRARSEEHSTRREASAVREQNKGPRRSHAVAGGAHGGEG